VAPLSQQGRSWNSLRPAAAAPNATEGDELIVAHAPPVGELYMPTRHSRWEGTSTLPVRRSRWR